MIFALLGGLVASAAGQTVASQLEQFAQAVNRPRAPQTVDFRNAVVRGNLVTVDVISTVPVAASPETLVGQIRQTVCGIPALSSLTTSSLVEMRFSVVAPDLTNPMQVSIRSTDCSPTQTAVSAQPKLVPPSQSGPRPATMTLDFRGVALGISYDDFRRLPHPDGTQSKVVCTGEKIIHFGVELEPSGVSVFGADEKASGVSKCIWLRTETGLGMNDTAGLNLPGGRYAVNEYSFSFAPDPEDGVLRLYSFVGITNSNAAGFVVEALTGKFGKAKIVAGSVSNGLGAKFSQNTYEWAKSSGYLLVQTPATTITKMAIIMEDNRMLKAVKDRGAAKRATLPNPI